MIPSIVIKSTKHNILFPNSNILAIIPEIITLSKPTLHDIIDFVTIAIPFKKQLEDYYYEPFYHYYSAILIDLDKNIISYMIPPLNKAWAILNIHSSISIDFIIANMIISRNYVIY